MGFWWDECLHVVWLLLKTLVIIFTCGNTTSSLDALDGYKERQDYILYSQLLKLLAIQVCVSE